MWTAYLIWLWPGHIAVFHYSYSNTFFFVVRLCASGASQEESTMSVVRRRWWMRNDANGEQQVNRKGKITTFTVESVGRAYFFSSLSSLPLTAIHRSTSISLSVAFFCTPWKSRAIKEAACRDAEDDRVEYERQQDEENASKPSFFHTKHAER